LAVGEEHAGGVDAYSLAYQVDGSGNPTSTSLTDPLNTVYTHNFTTVLGVVKPTGQNQPGGSGCSASASSLTYDPNGNVASRTDFNSNVSCFAHDLTRNLNAVEM
jgi:uncharacterized protein RhaS with RHS repeats